MNKVERIACLYLSFLNSSSKGLSFARLRRLMPLAYNGDFESARRKFERDKEELKRLGLELKYYPHRESYGEGQKPDQEHIYVPSEEIRQMPDLDLSENDHYNLADLILHAVRKTEYEPRERQLIYSAAKKLFYKNPALILEEKQENNSRLPMSWKERLTGSDTEPCLESVHYALKSHKPLKICYSNNKEIKEKRLLSGRGLISYKGRWCLVAYCHKSKEIRYFYVDRILSAEVCEARYYSDSHFDIRNHSLHPLSLKLHPLKSIKLTLRAEYEESFDHFLGGTQKALPNYRFEKGIFHFQTSNQSALFMWMLRNPNAVEKMSPPKVQKEYCDYIEKIKKVYRGIHQTKKTKKKKQIASPP